ncbi:MAG: class I fructose-bisphosphate aldolase [Terriglobales bacterium]
MGDYGKKLRLHRVLGKFHKRALVVAFDHAMVLGPIAGTESPVEKILRFSRAKADAVLVNLGLIHQFAQSSYVNEAPRFIARLDWTTVWAVMSSGGAGELRSALLASPEQALHSGADAVITYMVVGTGNADFESKELIRNAEVARECERVGIPLIVESLARGRAIENPCDPKWLHLHSRMAAELGADAVKTDYTGDPQTMKEVVDRCPIPILVLGGSRQASDESALEVVRAIVKSGAAGAFFGRNVFQADDMESFLRRARAVLDGEPESR